MIEQILLDYLLDQLAVPAYPERPADPPERYVLIEKTGGSQRNRLKSATLALQSHAESLYQAALLNEEVKGAMEQAVALPEISSAKLNSDYNFTDTTTREYRYQAVYDVTYY